MKCRGALVAIAVAAWLGASGDAVGQETPPPKPVLKPRAPLPPPGFLDTCLKLMQEKRYEDARNLLIPVVSNHPGWAKAHFYLGLTYHKQLRYEEARELFERSLELDPEYHAPRVFHGWALYYLGELPAARRSFESYLAVEPDYPDAIFALGLLDFDEDEIEAARARFERTIELAQASESKSTESKSRARLADVHIRTGELKKAKQELERSIELNPSNYETYFKLSRVLERLGDAAGAELARQMHRQVRERVRPAAPVKKQVEKP